MRKKMKKSLAHIILIIFGCIMVYPLFWMLSASFMTDNEIFQGLSIFSANLTIDNYVIGWRGIAGYQFDRFFLNTFVVSGVSIVGTVFSCSMAAYAFAKLNFKLKTLLFSTMMVTLMLPLHVRLIPQFILFNEIGWVNTFFPLTVPRFFAVDGFFIFLLVQFMRNISNELLEAPRIDGCGNFRIYINFIMPLSFPALFTVAIFTFIWTWNDFLSQLIYLNRPEIFTVALALRMFVDPTGTSAWGSLFAISTISLVPLLGLFILFQRYLIEGIAAGSVKG